jgi:hypothetical protein
MNDTFNNAINHTINSAVNNNINNVRENELRGVTVWNGQIEGTRQNFIFDGQISGPDDRTRTCNLDRANCHTV